MRARVAPVCHLRERVEVVTHNGLFAPCWGNVKDLISLRIAKNTGSKIVRVNGFMPPKGGINRETPTGKAVGQYLLWYNFFCSYLYFHAIDATLFILPYFPATFLLDLVNVCIYPSAVLCAQDMIISGKKFKLMMDTDFFCLLYNHLEARKTIKYTKIPIKTMTI